MVEKQVNIIPTYKNVVVVKTPSKLEFQNVNEKVKRKKKHKSKETSLLAYGKILEHLGERQAKVFEVIRRLKSCSNFMISKELNLPINSITPRVHELRKEGVVKQHKKDICKETGKLVIYWKPLWWEI